MIREPFAARVRALHEAWDERRRVAQLASTHTFDAQMELLRTLYSWTTEAVADVQAVYGDRVSIGVTLPPAAEQRPPSFSVILADRHALTLSLLERNRGMGTTWHISVWLEAESPSTTGSRAGPDRRNGHWTRARLEDVLLSVLGAYERGRSA
jgi:hypothetical protein